MHYSPDRWILRFSLMMSFQCRHTWGVYSVWFMEPRTKSSDVILFLQYDWIWYNKHKLTAVKVSFLTMLHWCAEGLKMRPVQAVCNDTALWCGTSQRLQIYQHISPAAFRCCRDLMNWRSFSDSINSCEQQILTWFTDFPALTTLNVIFYANFGWRVFNWNKLSYFKH